MHDPERLYLSSAVVLPEAGADDPVKAYLDSFDTPKFFLDWLQSLTPEQADQMWTWFDNNDIGEAIEVVAGIALPVVGDE